MKRFLVVLLILSSFSLFSQTDAGDLETYLNTKISSMPGDSGNNYKEPTASELTSWENCINDLVMIGDNLASARANADAVNYRIVEYTNTGPGGVNGTTYYILEEKATQTNYWGTYVFSISSSADKLILQAPHSDFDFNTGKQAIYSFVRLQPYALFLNGTHRCNHSQASSCSGTTTVCSGSSDPFKISDMAHNTNTVWQKTTEIIYNSVADSKFVQLHGFTKLASDPYVILSNGTDQTPSGLDYAELLQDALFSIDNSLTFKIAHIDNWTRLVGFTNTQGRYINQSTNPCNTAATSTSGRFIHVEQEKSKLRQDETGWSTMHQALSIIFTTPIGVEEYIKVQFKSENPFKNSLEFSAKNVKEINIYSLLGKELYSDNNESNSTDFNIDTHLFTSGVYILKLTSENGSITKKLIRE